MEREKAEEGEREGRGGTLVALVCGTLVYYHCGWRESSAVSLAADVLIVLLCSLAILGMLFRQMNISSVIFTPPLFFYLFFFSIYIMRRVDLAVDLAPDQVFVVAVNDF